MREERWGDALEKYARSFKADRPSVHWQMGVAYIKMEKYNEAEKAFVSALDILKEHPDELFVLLANDFAWSLITTFDNRISRADTAERWSRQANELTNNTNSNYLDTLARCIYIKGNTTEALRIQRQAVDVTPKPEGGVTNSLAEYELAMAIKDYSPMRTRELVLDTSWYRATLLISAVISANENLPKPNKICASYSTNSKRPILFAS